MKLALNLSKSNNYAFFDPQSKLHVTVSSPVDTVDRATPAIERGLKSKVLILLDDKGKKDPEEPAKPQEPVASPEPPVAPPAEQQEDNDVPPAQEPLQDEGTVPDLPAEEPKKPQKKGRGKKATTE